jgi:hypothetical protein
MQCALYDSNTENAKLTGIEYIVPGERLDALPAEEQQYWHPHNFEILSGTLSAPGVSDEMKILAGKIDSYGKTFHTWMTGATTGEAEDFPYGEPKLAWSLNEEGQLDDSLRAAYDNLSIDIEATAEARASYADKTSPQCGVNRLDGMFEGETQPIKGVSARQENCPDYSALEAK